MKLPFVSARPQPTAEVKPADRPGPTVIDPRQFKHVGGGSPKGTWAAASGTQPTSPKGTW